jgi:hypothetical protein
MGVLDSAKRMADFDEMQTSKPAATFTTKKEAQQRHSSRNR